MSPQDLDEGNQSCWQHCVLVGFKDFIPKMAILTWIHHVCNQAMDHEPCLPLSGLILTLDDG